MPLCITRKEGEWFVIDGNIRVQIAAIRGNRVKVAIVAPRSVRVEREDQYDERTKFQDGGPQ